MIPKSIVKAIGQEGVSGLYLVADPSQCKEIRRFICQTFDEKWEMACLAVKKKYGDCLEYTNEWPSGIDIYPWDEGLFITFPALYISYDEGIKCDIEFGIAALENTLKEITAKFPQNYYFGFIAFIDFNDHIVQKTICSPGKKVPERLEFIAKEIEYINKNIDSFIDIVKDNCYKVGDYSDGEWIGDLIDFLHIYEDKVDFRIFDQILNVASEYIEDDDLYYELKEKVESWKNPLMTMKKGI